MQKIYNLKEWVPVIVLAFAVFVFGTSEFTPVGLLPDIAKSIGQTEARTGLLLTGYAWTVAIMALPMTMLTANMERKKLILSVLSVFLIGNLFVAMSNSFETIFSSRIVIALSHAIFWSIIPPLAYRISPNGKSTYGLAIISGGAASSAILGVPICRYIGHNFGWNSAFYTITITAAIIIAILYFALPKLAPKKTKRKRALYRIRKNKTLLASYAITMLFITGHFSVFTYIVPFLNKVSNFHEDYIAFILLMYGAIGVIGIVIAGKFMEKNLRQILLYGTSFVMLLLLSTCFIGSSKALIICILILWSITSSALFPTLQSWIIRNAKKDSDMASSIHSSMFNIGIGAGALVGGTFITIYGTQNVGYIGSAIIIVPIIIIYIFTKEKIKKSKTKKIINNKL